MALSIRLFVAPEHHFACRRGRPRNWRKVPAALVEHKPGHLAGVEVRGIQITAAETSMVNLPAAWRRTPSRSVRQRRGLECHQSSCRGRTQRSGKAKQWRNGEQHCALKRFAGKSQSCEKQIESTKCASPTLRKKSTDIHNGSADYRRSWSNSTFCRADADDY